MRFSLLFFAVTTLALAAEPTIPDEAQLKALTARFAPVEIKADVSKLPASEKEALRLMVDAAKILDAVFLRQVAPLNETYLSELARDDTPLGRARLHYFRLNAGAWSRLDRNQAFLPGVGAKPEAATFYPVDATREEVDRWLQSLSPEQRESAAGFFTTIRRAADHSLMAVPYSQEYQAELVHASRLLQAAADATRQPTLKDFLQKRARAFL